MSETEALASAAESVDVATQEATGGQDTTAASQGAAEGASQSAANSGDWRVGMDGDLKEFADRFTSPVDMAKAALDLRKANSSMIRVPGKDAKPEQVAAFRKAIGAGDSEAAYEAAFSKPADDAELSDTDKAVRGKVAQVLLKHNAPVALAGELETVVSEVAEGLEAERERVAVKAREDAQAALKKEWGADYESNAALAVRAAQTFGGQDFIDFVNQTVVNGQKLGDHPLFIKAFGQIGRRMGEGAFIGAVGQEQRASIGEKLTELDDAFYAAQRSGDRAKMASLDKQRLALREQLYGAEPIVGAAGRSA